jgi:NADPH-dependent 2,4-dienoyl-CoA reductase/sulfur reductase-like enzyme
MFERSDYISFANCGLPYHIGETIKDRNNLLVQTVKGMKDRFGIDVRVKTEVLKINPKEKTVLAKNLVTGLAPEIPKFFPKNSYSIGISIRRAIISNKFKIV